MSEIEHERWSEDIAAYALGALESGRAGALEHHLEDCERCRAELRWLTPAVQALPEGVERVEPPPGLRARLMAEVGADGNAPAPGRRSIRIRIPGLRPAIGFAALALVVAAVLGYAIGGGSDGSDTNTISAGKAPGVTATMVEEADSGTLRLANVHDLPEGKVLQAWVQRDGNVEPVPALFVPDDEGRTSTDLPDMSGVEVVMVTAEPRGGSNQPTSPPIVTLPIPG